jgi:hypothetical protein
LIAFADTGFWYGLHVPKDRRHIDARALWPPDRPFEAILHGDDRSAVSEYWHAVRHYLDTGDDRKLWPLEGQAVSGRPLVTDLDAIDEGTCPEDPELAAAVLELARGRRLTPARRRRWGLAMVYVAVGSAFYLGLGAWQRNPLAVVFCAMILAYALAELASLYGPNRLFARRRALADGEQPTLFTANVRSPT